MPAPWLQSIVASSVEQLFKQEPERYQRYRRLVIEE